MVRYVCLIQLTDKGAHEIKRSTERAKAFARIAKKAGVKIEAQYWTLGSYDGVSILSAKDEGSILHCLKTLAAAGYVRTQTLRAYTAKEFDTLG